MKKFNPSISKLAGEDWVTEYLILLSNYPRENSIGMEYNMNGDETIFPSFNSTPKFDERTTPFVQSLIEDEDIHEDVLSIRWSVQR